MLRRTFDRCKQFIMLETIVIGKPQLGQPDLAGTPRFGDMHMRWLAFFVAVKMEPVAVPYQNRGHQESARTSANFPVIAAAAAMAGDMRWVRPPRP